MATLPGRLARRISDNGKPEPFRVDLHNPFHKIILMGNGVKCACFLPPGTAYQVAPAHVCEQVGYFFSVFTGKGESAHDSGNILRLILLVQIGENLLLQKVRTGCANYALWFFGPEIIAVCRAALSEPFLPESFLSSSHNY